jgi:hypothetical protein
VRGALVALAIAAAVGATTDAVAGARASVPKRSPQSGVAVGELAWVIREVDRAELPLKATWRRLVVGDDLRTGDTLRTGERALARVEFPWMRVTLGANSMLTIPASAVLSTVLEQGRAEFAGEGRDIVKIRVGEGEVRGGGHLVLRRSVGRTTATALAGAFRIRAASRTVEIKAGEGTVVADGRPPEAASPLPPAPSAILPGEEVAYVRAGQPVELRWTAKEASTFHVELLGLGGDGVLLARDTGPPPARLEVPWLGTYRWRVSTRDARGVEGPPSSTGLVCLVER